MALSLIYFLFNFWFQIHPKKLHKEFKYKEILKLLLFKKKQKHVKCVHIRKYFSPPNIKILNNVNIYMKFFINISMALLISHKKLNTHARRSQFFFCFSINVSKINLKKKQWNKKRLWEFLWCNYGAVAASLHYQLVTAISIIN